MDPAVLESLLKAIRDGIAGNRGEDDVMLPPFDPEKNDNGAESWCNNIDTVAKDRGWSGITTVSKAGKALKGSALLWFETWDPDNGRTWENFKTCIKDLYPEKRNLSEKLSKAVLYTSDVAETYCEYAREKLRLLRNTKITFSEGQLVELICGGISDINIKMASFNSRVDSTAELISLFTTYTKNPRKRPSETNNVDVRSSATKRPRSEHSKPPICFLCNKTGHVKSQCFKNKNQDTPNSETPKIQCSYCKKIGHDESVCFFKKRDSTKNTNSTSNNVNCSTNGNLSLTDVKICEKPIKALIDSGASCSVLKESIANSFGRKLEPCSTSLKGIGNGMILISSKVSLPVKFNNNNLEIEFCVANDADCYYDCLIGRNAVQNSNVAIVLDSSGCKLEQLNYTESVNTVNVPNAIDDHVQDILELTSHLDLNLQHKIINILTKFPKVLPNSNYISTVKTGEMTIRLKSDEIVYYRPYRLASTEKEKVQEIISDLLKKNIIRESQSPFASPVILVKKKDGSDRLCIDYRALNKIIEKDRYPLPLIEDQIDKLGKAKYFISIDMKNGFHQIPIKDECIKYTAFVTPDGHFEFLKMPFGICNGPSVFQRAINKAVETLKFLLVYIDDLLIPFSEIAQGLEYLERTIEALSLSGFTINLKKCKFFVQEINYLGRHISSEGVRPSNEKVNALTNSPVPGTVKEVRQFMGLASYFRKFIPEFAYRTACITKLTKKDQKWQWGPEQDAAREYVIKHLVSKPLLNIFNPELKTELHTDASSIGYGAILLQKEDNQCRVIAYFSKRTSPAESKYPSYELETLAIFNALKQFRVYLLGLKFTIITDCNSIKSTMNKRDISPRVARWWTYMQDFSFDIVYKKGKFVTHVDYLSRNPTLTPAVSSEAINIINEPDPLPSWLHSAQSSDPETQNLIEKVRAGDIDTNRYVIKNDLLLYRNEDGDPPKFFIPKGYRLSLLRLFHDENCHVGYDKTLNKILENFWFPSLAAFTKKYISHCLVCIKGKGHSGPKQGFLHPIEKTTPFHTLHLDCTGP